MASSSSLDFASVASEGISNNGKFKQALRLIVEWTEDLGGRIKATGPAADAAMNDCLSEAMGNVYRLAVLIRGDFDDRTTDERELDVLLPVLLSGFKTVRTQSERRFDDLSRLHARIQDVKVARLEPLKQGAMVKTTRLRDEINSLSREISSAQTGIDKLEKSFNESQDTLRSLSQKEQMSSSTAVVVDNSAEFLCTLDPSRLRQTQNRPNSFSAMTEIQKQISDLREQLLDLIPKLRARQEEIRELRGRKIKLERQQADDKAALSELPGIERAVTQQTSHADAMIRDVSSLKSAAIDMYKEVSLLAKSASVAARESIRKKDFALAILDVCAKGAVHEDQISTIVPIINEVVNGWGSRHLPDEVFQKSLEARNRLQALTY